MFILKAVAAFALIALAAANDSTEATNNCKEVSFSVTGTAQNRNLTGISLDLSNLGIDAIINLFNDAPLIEITGTQTLEATYCTATKKNGNNRKLQMLYGSITAAREGWQALGGVGTDFPAYNPNKYSWTQFANAQGYPTLAIDRLGTGKSDKPDPLLVVQAPYESALYVNLASQIRSGKTSIPSYDYLIFVGNSYGSQLGTGIAGSAPTAYDEFVLTGFTSTVQKGFLGVSLVLPAPAQVVDPARFGTVPLGYLTTLNKAGRTGSFFGSKVQVSFEDTVADLFFQRKDLVSVGQLLSVYAIPFFGGGFTGRVLVLDGENDQAFCGLGSPVLGPAFCGSQPADTGALFPTAKYNFKTVDRIGHGVQLHERSQVLYDIAHRFLAGESFTDGVVA